MNMTRAVIVTGASGSMGCAATRHLAGKGYSVIMACRNPEKAGEVRQGILADMPDADLRIERLDLNSFASVRNFAARLISSGMTLEGLFNNAGVIARGHIVTEDGFESTMQTNCLSPCLLTSLLMDRFAEGAHIVNMVSLTCRFGRLGQDIFSRREEDFHRLGTYSDSKLALLLNTISLREETLADYPGIRINVADPGIVDSNMISMGKWFDPLADVFFRPFCSSPQKGVEAAMRALGSERDLLYYVGERNNSIASRYTDHPERAWLWKETKNILSL